MVAFRCVSLLAICLIFVSFNGGAESHRKGILKFLLRGLRSKCRCRCGQPNRVSRMLGGEYTLEHEFPWLAALHIKGSLRANGVLINDRYVLSSASQLAGLTPYDVKVSLGNYDTCYPDTTSTNVSVAAVIMHPEFAASTRSHDVALLKLNNPVILGRNVKSICLPHAENSYLGQVATVAGWSEVEQVQDVSLGCRPRKLGLPVLGPQECAWNPLEPEFARADRGCLGVVGGPSHICGGDSGFPVMFRSHKGTYELIGIMSDKNSCGTIGMASFSKINQNMAWIKQNTIDACYCARP